MQHIGRRIIETERLILRRFDLLDAYDMFNNWASDPNVCKFLAWAPYLNVRDVQNKVKEWVAAYAVYAKLSTDN